ncbi:MAG: S8 family serine peptidase [Candidatus Krumholzibacteriia bacterium]
MKLGRAVLAGLTILLAWGVASAGTISPGLEAQLAELAPGGTLKVLVVLREQVDTASLDRQLRWQKAALPIRHQTVVQTLREVAARTQGDLVAALASEKAGGRVVGYTPHWLVNAVVVTAEGDAVRAIATRDDVERVEPDLVAELVAPVVAAKDVAATGAVDDVRGIGTAPGVRAVRAPDVWTELGVRGDGALVGTLDTGVDGSHPALAERWRGNFAPPGECWLDAANLGDPDFPRDRYDHGTHVMGTLTGLAPGDTIGVAPGARWIAVNGIAMETGPAFDNAVLASLEFLTDPDGDPTTHDDVPDVVQNSWGVNKGYTGYLECDSRWWTAIDNCEAAGVVLLWAAGNEGPGASTLRSPADRAASPISCFSVGSTGAESPYTISSFSSRGPSTCADLAPGLEIKPELVAPGAEIYSSVPGGGYQYLSGTSMSGPHVAGVVALMRSANPDVDVTTIKQVLMATAVDLGREGEDDVYGHGFVDAYEAVLAVMGGLGHVEGTVTDLTTGQLIAGASLRVVDGFQSTTTDANGHFRLPLRPDTPTTVEVSFFGHAVQTFTATVAANQSVIRDVSTYRQNWAAVRGVVYGDGQPLPGASVAPRGTPVPPVVTDESGAYSLSLPIDLTGSYELVADSFGWGAVPRAADVVGDIRLDFQLRTAQEEDFESGDFSRHDWSSTGEAAWLVEAGQAWDSDHCARSGGIGDGQASVLTLTVDVPASGEMGFFYRVSSEAGFDFLEFHVDGVRVGRWAGEVAWTEFITPLEAGAHELRWVYDKDGSTSSGEDAAWLDMISLPAGTPPAVVLGHQELTFGTLVDGIGIRRTTVQNLGGSALLYHLALESLDGPAAASAAAAAGAVAGAPHRTLDGDETARSGGGPDRFGYRWLDSTDPDGPEYAWVDIADVGTQVGAGDDATHGPFPLGFPFRYYGEDYTAVRVCTNGFLQFAGSDDHYTNQDIPTPGAPDAIVAPFWDDLNPNSGGAILQYRDEANARFIVQWERVPHYNPSDTPETFQVILHADGSILFQYRQLSAVESCTVGIESQDGTDGLRVVYNGAYLFDGLAIRFSPDPPVPWLVVLPASGSVPAGGAALIEVVFDAAELAPGTYRAALVVTTNDPTASLVQVPVTLVVTADPTPVDGPPPAFGLRGAVPNPFNPSTDIHFSLHQAGAVDLRLYDLSGRLVRTLVADVRPAGTHQVRWNGRDHAGRPAASGAYHARLSAGGRTAVTKLTLVR